MMPTLAQQQGGDALMVILVLVVGIIVLAWLIFIFNYGFIFIKALLSGAYVSIFEIISMRLRGVRPSLIVDGYIMAIKSGVPVDRLALEVHSLAGGDVKNVVQALVAARRAEIPLGFEDACALDLAGQDVLEGVKARIMEKFSQDLGNRAGES